LDVAKALGSALELLVGKVELTHEVANAGREAELGEVVTIVRAHTHKHKGTNVGTFQGKT